MRNADYIFSLLAGPQVILDIMAVFPPTIVTSSSRHGTRRAYHYLFAWFS